MPAPYYGDPEALRVYNRNSKSFVDSADYEAELDTYDSVVRPIIESDLFQIFESVPTPNSKMQNIVSVLWLYKMTEEIQGTKASTTRAASTGYKDETETKYETLLKEIKSGAKLVPGAVRRRSTLPGVKIYTSQRVVPTDKQEPVVVGSLFPHGLRR